MKGKSIDLKFIISVLTKHLVFIIVAAILGGILGYLYVTQTTSTTYTARVELVVALERDFFETEDEPDDSGKTNLNGVSNTVNAQRLISTFMHILKTNSAATKVVEEIKANDGYLEDDIPVPAEAEPGNISKDWINWIGAGSVKSSLNFTAIEDTNIFVATITTNNYYLTYAICRAFETTAPKAIEDLYYNVGAVECFESSAIPYETPVDVKLPTLIGAVLGAVLVAAVFVLISYMDDTIKFESDIMQFNVLFLGGVPDINPKEKNEMGKYSYNYGYGYGYGYGRKHRSDNEDSNI
ncbi:MAG: hypothetical protein J6A50_05005 [Clostridia bacterium]|nr:hypothetical protein [Clostridia bacterium]